MALQYCCRYLAAMLQNRNTGFAKSIRYFKALYTAICVYWYKDIKSPISALKSGFIVFFERWFRRT